MKNYTRDEIIALVEQEISEAAENGETFYVNIDGERAQGGRCFYVHRYDARGVEVHPRDANAHTKRIPGCMVGRVLINKLGVPMEWFDRNEGGWGASLAGVLSDDHGISMNDDAVRFLARLQAEQDGGDDWSSALIQAKTASE